MISIGKTAPRESCFTMPPPGDWQSFTRPREIVETCRHDEVMDCLRRVEHLVESQGLHAAGFVSYEAAPAFDRALTVREAPGFPLLWFGLFPAVETMSSIFLGCSGTCVTPASKPGCDRWQPSVTADEYAAVIGRLREQIAAGETYQVNYTFRLKQPARSDPWSLFEDLVAAQPAALCRLHRNARLRYLLGLAGVVFRA